MRCRVPGPVVPLRARTREQFPPPDSALIFDCMSVSWGGSSWNACKFATTLILAPGGSMSDGAGHNLVSRRGAPRDLLFRDPGGSFFYCFLMLHLLWLLCRGGCPRPSPQQGCCTYGNGGKYLPALAQQAEQLPHQPYPRIRRPSPSDSGNQVCSPSIAWTPAICWSAALPYRPCSGDSFSQQVGSGPKTLLLAKVVCLGDGGLGRTLGGPPFVCDVTCLLTSVLFILSHCL